MMAMDVAEDCESMGVPVEAYSNVEQLCKKHSKVSSSKAYETRLVMEVFD
jgi:hypothetical protein